MFKPNPKQMVEQKARFLYGRTLTIKVTGKRLTPLEAKDAGLTQGLEGTYLAECHIDGKFIAQAHNRDWRTAYKKLKVAVEAAHSATKLLSTLS